MITFIFIGALVLFFLIEILLWNDRELYGPFSSKTKKVVRAVFDGEEYKSYERPVNTFDYLRRFSGIYRVEGNNWVVIERAVAVWECPKCLGFWLAAPLSIWFFLNSYSVIETIIYHFAVTSLAYIIYLQCHK